MGFQVLPEFSYECLAAEFLICIEVSEEYAASVFGVHYSNSFNYLLSNVRPHIPDEDKR